MSDLAATGCCNNDCGCASENSCSCGNGSWLWILILLSHAADAAMECPLEIPVVMDADVKSSGSSSFCAAAAVASN